MLERDEAKRLDADGIKAHPWFNVPLADPFKAALGQLAGEQGLIEQKRLEVGAYQVHCWGPHAWDVNPNPKPQP